MKQKYSDIKHAISQNHSYVTKFFPSKCSFNLIYHRTIKSFDIMQLSSVAAELGPA